MNLFTTISVLLISILTCRLFINRDNQRLNWQPIEKPYDPLISCSIDKTPTLILGSTSMLGKYIINRFTPLEI